MIFKYYRNVIFLKYNFGMIAVFFKMGFIRVKIFKISKFFIIFWKFVNKTKGESRTFNIT